MSLLKLAGKYNKQNPRSPFCVSRVLCNINVSSYDDTVSRSLDFEPTLFLKVKVFTLKKCPPFRELLRTRETPNMEKEMGRVTKQKNKNIFLKKCCYYSCQVLKYTPWRPVVCALVGTQLESTPFSACWAKWHLVSAAERLWGDTVTQVLNAKLPGAAKHADANTECKCVCACSNLRTNPHLHTQKWQVQRTTKNPQKAIIKHCEVKLSTEL